MTRDLSRGRSLLRRLVGRFKENMDNVLVVLGGLVITVAFSLTNDSAFKDMHWLLTTAAVFGVMSVVAGFFMARERERQERRRDILAALGNASSNQLLDQMLTEIRGLRDDLKKRG